MRGEEREGETRGGEASDAGAPAPTGAADTGENANVPPLFEVPVVIVVVVAVVVAVVADIIMG